MAFQSNLLIASLPSEPVEGSYICHSPYEKNMNRNYLFLEFLKFLISIDYFVDKVSEDLQVLFSLLVS